MEILLLHDKEKIGKAGEVVTVADGYARNYLLPRRFAIPATANAVARAKELAQKITLQHKKTIEELQVLAERLNTTELTIPVKVGKTGKLFGRITNQDVAKALAKEGIVIDRRKILLVDPIKELGVYKVSLKLHPQVEVTLKVIIVGS